MGWFGSIQNGFCWLFLVGHGNAAGGVWRHECQGVEEQRKSYYNRRSGCTSLIDSNLILRDPVPLGEYQRIVYFIFTLIGVLHDDEEAA